MRRSTQLDPAGSRYLVSNDFGDYAVLDQEDHGRLIAGKLTRDDDRITIWNLEAF